MQQGRKIDPIDLHTSNKRNKSRSVRAATPLLIACLLARPGCTKLPERRTTAIVVDIAAPEGRFRNRALVTARTADGVSGVRSVPLANLTCRVGDVVEARERGTSLLIDRDACVR